jgi:hypothetical protein
MPSPVAARLRASRSVLGPSATPLVLPASVVLTLTPGRPHGRARSTTSSGRTRSSARAHRGARSSDELRSLILWGPRAAARPPSRG